jgi:putative transposase
MRIWMPIVKLEVDLSEIRLLLQHFQENRRKGIQRLTYELRRQVSDTINHLLDTEFTVFIGSPDQRTNKKNGYKERTYAIKGIGSIQVRVPRDRNGEFSSVVVPSYERMDPRIREDIAILQLAGLSNRTLGMISRRLLGIEVGKDLVNDSLGLIQESAVNWLTRPLTEKQYWCLFVDGTNFRVRRRDGVEKEPLLIVLGVDENNRRSVLTAEPGCKESKEAWREVFRGMKQRGLDGRRVRLGVMDGLPGLEEVFREEFPHAVTQRCWVHMKRNALQKTPKRLQEAFSHLLAKVMYAESENDAREGFIVLKETINNDCSRAVSTIEKDLDSLLVHYRFPSKLWPTIKTTNAIERVNKELKRRTKSMETVSEKSQMPLVAFTALRLEMGWRQHRIDAPQMQTLANTHRRNALGETDSFLAKEKVHTNGLENVIDELDFKH